MSKDLSGAFDIELVNPEIGVFSGHSEIFRKHHAAMAEAMIAQHHTEKYEKGYSFVVQSKLPCFSELYSAAASTIGLIHKKVYKRDLVLAPRNSTACWAFVLDETRAEAPKWHNHIATSSYNAVYYVRATDTDSIFLRVPEDRAKPETGQDIEVPISEGMLLMMPNWLFHKPKSIDGKRGIQRIAINMEFMASPESFPGTSSHE
jgi:hypothetical protein